jgi:predicted O-methyltransferase YrrM
MLDAIRRATVDLGLRLPGVGGLISEVKTARNAFREVAAGHYDSPIPDHEEIERDAGRLFGRPPKTLPGIDLHEPEQMALLKELQRHYPPPVPDTKTVGHRYFFLNDWYPAPDGVSLYTMMRHLKPRRIIEVGSGYSSALMLDTNERFFEGRIALTFIDPHPERLMGLLRQEDRQRVEIITHRVQDVPVARFEALDANDILFIDSSHVSKIGSDVNYLVGEILPALRRGVYVHAHDLFYPFEYPQSWIAVGRYFTEAYLLRAFLAFNSVFQIVLWNSYLEQFHRDWLAAHMPLMIRQRYEAGSLWIRRIE